MPGSVKGGELELVSLHGAHLLKPRPPTEASVQDPSRGWHHGGSSATVGSQTGFVSFAFFFFFFGQASSMRKFPGKGLKLSHSSDNVESLMARPLGNSSSATFDGEEPPGALC